MTLTEKPTAAKARSAARSTSRARANTHGWRPAKMTWLVTILALVGVSVFLYPTIAAWFSSYNQSQIVDNYAAALEHVEPSAREQLARARQYNDTLSAGVDLEAHQRKATGVGTSSDQSLDYNEILNAGNGLMGRVKIPKINVDLPIYHGTDDDTLDRGAGHLEGSHLPIGGIDTHSVITAHRGLANATMFNDLDKIVTGDRFTLEVFGEVLTYEVIETRVVEPDETDTLRVRPGADVVTLITCTPLGINSHRILVTAERVTPTPAQDLEDAGKDSEVPSFPWWAVLAGAVLLALGLYIWRAGYTDARIRARKADRTRAGGQDHSHRI